MFGAQFSYIFVIFISEKMVITHALCGQLNTTFNSGDGGNQPITASAKRTFSLLSKLLLKDRNFLSENITNYICGHYN